MFSYHLPVSCTFFMYVTALYLGTNKLDESKMLKHVFVHYLILFIFPYAGHPFFPIRDVEFLLKLLLFLLLHNYVACTICLTQKCILKQNCVCYLSISLIPIVTDLGICIMLPCLLVCYDCHCSSSMFLFTKARIAEKHFHRWLTFVILCLHWMKFFSTGVLIFYQPTHK